MRRVRARRRSTALAAALCLLAGGSAAAEEPAAGDRFWPGWRGPLGTGAAPHADPPVEWSESRNLRWKAELPGGGHSTPAVWGDRVFVTAAVPYGDPLPPAYSGLPGGHDERPVTHRHRFVVLALNRASGRVLWQRVVRDDLPRAGGHYTASLASPSPVTDGEHLIVSFGSHGLYGLDLEGGLRWELDLGPMRPLHGHGEGSSPALFGGALVVNWDHEGESFLAAFDKGTGALRWKSPREGGSSWTTPIVIEAGGRPQVVVSGSRTVRGYDLAGGGMIWECPGLSVENVVATPVAGFGLVFAGSSYDRQAVLAIPVQPSGGEAGGRRRAAWSRTRGAPYVPSFLLYGEALYFVRHFQNILTRVDARTGRERPGPMRLKSLDRVFASPVAAAGRVYVTGRNGVTVVLSHADAPAVLAVNRLDDGFSASAAVAGGELYLRGGGHLYCIAEQPPPAP